ncbi:MAG: V-type ATP synthase subunit E [Synergistaceae bacterium]|jgi:V/A-type H+-transporting ATPase subunit E|nr:V-type ATP synthase subunit E [Synergistaceae bacterium]
MSLAQITEKIEQDARNEAESILAAARVREEEIQKETGREAGEINAAAESRFEKERPEIFKRREIVARLDIGNIHLGIRRKLIQDVFDAALERLGNLGRGEYLAFCGKLLKEASAGGEETLEISSREKHIDQEWLDEFNSRNRKDIKISENRGDFSGGFVLSRGRICVNCSWEMLMRVAQESLEAEVVKRLFQA